MALQGRAGVQPCLNEEVEANWIVKNLQLLRKQKIHEEIELLEKLGLIKQDETGTWQQSNESISTGNEISSEVASLQVRASTSGVIQQVSLQLGERAHVGDSVALVADQNTLFAELQVQEVRVRDIALGQLVTIDTRTSEILGKFGEAK